MTSGGDVVVVAVVGRGGGGRHPAAKVVVVGGGAGGVELALAMQYRLKQLFREAGLDPDMVVVEIVNRGNVVLSSHNRCVLFVVSDVHAS